MPESPPSLSAAEMSRYSRQILLDEVGMTGQEKLAAARVLVIGAGGLGSPAAFYLAAAGIGTLGIADPDQVELHNLQRQLLHDTASIGKSKVLSAAQRLRALNPHIRVIEHPQGITAENAVEIFKQYDVIVDGTDNFTARYINNDAAYFTTKPLVFGSIFKFEGQVTVFDATRGGPCYRCLFPEPPAAGSVPGCGEAGVIGALCGVIGSLQSVEVLKLILELGESLRGRLLTYDALSQRFQELRLPKVPTCQLCGDKRLPHPLPMPVQTSRAASSVLSGAVDYPIELSVAEARDILSHSSEGAVIIDVREPWETQICQVRGSKVIPMREVPEKLDSIPRDLHLLMMCHHGVRSRKVTDFLRSNGFAKVSNITGGIAAWADEIEPNMERY